MTPVVVFGYNRPHHIALALESLSRCERLDECRVHIICDGPKDLNDAEAVDAARATAHEWATELGAEVIEREKNLGLARSVVTAVTELCERYGRVIVVEDDFVLAPDFLDYMLQALNIYADAENVYQVSAYMEPTPHPPKPDAFLIPFVTSRGWATWQRAWKAFEWDPQGAEELFKNADLRSRFNLDDGYPFSAMMAKRLAAQNDSWAILWWWSVFRRGGLGVFPRRSLLWVGGFDGTGTHSGTVSGFAHEVPTDFLHRRLSQPITFQQGYQADAEAFARVKDTYRRRYGIPPPLGFLGRMRSGVNRALKRMHLK